MTRLTPQAAQPTGATTDFAEVAQLNAWLRHPVYGDPSFDTFTRTPGNPIERGAPPLEWPVNGFLFADPVSGHWFVYVGEYSFGYQMGPGKGMRCIVWRSTDRGATWTRLGPIFPEEPFVFGGDTDPVGYAPDVSVVYHDGKYHLIYDYLTRGGGWDNLTEPLPGQSNGIGYAWADRPEGPYHHLSPPIYRVNDHPWYKHGRYRRAYAQTLIRRQHDWLIVMMMDSGPNFGWALVGMTAQKPEGPYCAPVFLRCVDDDYYHPPLLEFFPAFTHAGEIYAPATSVALNRDYQGMFRVPIEDAMKPEAWKLWQDGSVWHGEDVENEHYGIWGQTFSGMVGEDGQLHVMFPSRDPAGMGTINLASRPWDHPYRERGFAMSGHQGPSLTLLRRSYGEFRLEAEFTLRGQAALVWGWQAPLGPDRAAADATLHPLTLTRHHALELGPEQWRIVRYDEATSVEVARGALAPAHAIRLELTQTPEGQVQLSLDGKLAWSGPLPLQNGPIGLLARKDSYLDLTRFALAGESAPAHFVYNHMEAILGAAAIKDWQVRKDATFHYGEGAVSERPGARAKWNVQGTAFRLWAPRGPQFGKGELLVDGKTVATIDFKAAQPQPSAIVHESLALPPGPHAIILRAAEGVTPLDALEVTQ